MSALRDLAERLELPPAARREFLAEVAGDFEDLYRALRARGLGRDAAWRAAVEMLLPDDHALRAMTMLHRPLWVRWSERLARNGSFDAALLVLLTSIVLLSTLVALVNGGVLAPLTWSLAPVLFIGLAESALIACKAFELFARGELRPEKVRRGMREIAVLGVGAVAVGLLLAGLGFVRTAPVAPSASAATATTHLLIAWILTAVAQLSLALVIALEGALAWMLLGWHAARLEHDAARSVARIRAIHFRAEEP
jgi:hypothetical protein